MTTDTNTMSFVETFNRSTIYDNHVVRRMNTIQFKDDARSAPIRILSFIPGFRLLIHPYNNQSNEKIMLMNQQHQQDDQQPTHQLEQHRQMEQQYDSASVSSHTDATIFTMMNSDNNNSSLMMSKTSNTISNSIMYASGGLCCCLTAISLLRFRGGFTSVNAASGGVPLFQSNNTAAYAFLKPAAGRMSTRNSSAQLLKNIPATRNIVALSFLVWVGYKNVLYNQQQQLKANNYNNMISE